jgi:hypothetical protein
LYSLPSSETACLGMITAKFEIGFHILHRETLPNPNAKGMVKDHSRASEWKCKVSDKTNTPKR